ncbi:hypothetical protein D5S19_29305 [Amycolatopsis panacis]|uniref:CN hydrolase domain-containing protein n=1 Tax=Amycolatopsis panacis TaxID=2340917 RepID=A0A419HLF8_9PSEU|nr:hypothetical protein D5S19_29305 [Amycolatopsis panacis]
MWVRTPRPTFATPPVVPIFRSRSWSRTISSPDPTRRCSRRTSDHLGISICADLRWPEVYRVLALKGARIILCVTGFLSPRLDHWEFLLRARATENQVFVGGLRYDRDRCDERCLVRRAVDDRGSVGRSGGHRVGRRRDRHHDHRSRSRRSGPRSVPPADQAAAGTVRRRPRNTPSSPATDESCDKGCEGSLHSVETSGDNSEGPWNAGGIPGPLLGWLRGGQRKSRPKS